MMDDLIPVAAGVDTLYLAVRGELDDAVLNVLTALRDSGDDDATTFSLDEQDGFVQLRPHGWRGYPLWLSSPRYELMLGAARPFPVAYVQLHSEYIHTVGVEDAAARVTGLLARRFFRRDQPMMVTPSRIDVYADVQGWEPGPDDYARFVCRAVGRRQYDEPSQMHGGGKRLTGFTFGRGDVVARIYNKTVELRGRGQDWPLAVWSGGDPDAEVWRVEFQYRRGALTSMGLRSLPAALEARQGLWDYGTGWLSLRAPSGNAARRNWPVAPVWDALRRVVIGSPCSPLVRERVRRANELRLMQGLAGYVSALAASWNVQSLSGAMSWAEPRLQMYFDERGVDFGQLVRTKRSRRPAA
jgi:hypothetical protein